MMSSCPNRHTELTEKGSAIQEQASSNSNEVVTDKNVANVENSGSDGAVAAVQADESNENLDESGKPLSKNALKRKRKWERVMEVKRRRKEQDKEIKLAKAKAEGRDLEQEKIKLKKRTEEGINRKKRQEEWEAKFLPLAKKSWQVCIDCSFEDQMTTKEVNSLSLQLRYCYANNKRNTHPCLLTVSSLSGSTLENLERVSGFEDWTQRAFSYSEKPLNELFKDRLNDVVYLTSDSENVVEHLENTKIYVIGGIVDRNRLKRAAITRADELGVSTAKLPLDTYLQKMKSTKVLTTNHVFEILLKYREHGNNWEKALLDVLPQRKGINAANKSDDSGNYDNSQKVRA